jgi:hypothetical protein
VMQSIVLTASYVLCYNVDYSLETKNNVRESVVGEGGKKTESNKSE